MPSFGSKCEFHHPTAPPPPDGTLPTSDPTTNWAPQPSNTNDLPPAPPSYEEAIADPNC